MGFFKNLFEKKVCDICGGEIGMLGNRKLEDGNCCKNCAKKLSPWFTERKHSTVAEIRQQLESREANRKEVAAFQASRVYGRDMRVLIDEKARKFMVTRAKEKDLEEENPDVLEFSQVTACDLDIRESKNEVYKQVRDEEGNTKNESYSPRRYKYSYNFMLTIQVSHPYIDEIQLSLSNGYFRVHAREQSSGMSFIFGGGPDTYGLEGSINPPDPRDRQNNDDYVRYEQWAREIRELLLSRPAEAPVQTGGFDGLIAAFVKAAEQEQAAKASGDSVIQSMALNARLQAMQALYDAYQADPAGAQKAGVLDVIQKYQNPEKPAQPGKTTVTCPWCGAETASGNFCENCGGSLKQQ